MLENLLLFQAVNLCLLLNSTSSGAAKKYERHDEKLLYHKISHNPPTHYSMFSLQHPQFLVFFFCVLFYAPPRFQHGRLMTQLCSPFILFSFLFSLYVLTLPLHFKYFVLQSELNHNCSASATVQYCNRDQDLFL